MLGAHLIASSSATRNVVATNPGEVEFNVRVDANASKGIASRRGVGRGAPASNSSVVDTSSSGKTRADIQAWLQGYRWIVESGVVGRTRVRLGPAPGSGSGGRMTMSAKLSRMINGNVTPSSGPMDLGTKEAVWTTIRVVTYESGGEVGNSLEWQ